MLFGPIQPAFGPFAMSHLRGLLLMAKVAVTDVCAYFWGPWLEGGLRLTFNPTVLLYEATCGWC